MKVSKPLATLVLSLSIFGLSACGAQGEAPLRACTAYEDEVLDLDDEGECYAPDDDTKKKRKSVKKKVKRTSDVGVSTVRKAKKAKKKSSGFGFSTGGSRKSSGTSTRSTRSGKR